jgi:hypothetical protein
LAAHCLNTYQRPRQVYRDKSRREQFQELLADKLGFVLAWPEELRLTPRDNKDPLGI